MDLEKQIKKILKEGRMPTPQWEHAVREIMKLTLEKKHITYKGKKYFKILNFHKHD